MKVIPFAAATVAVLSLAGPALGRTVIRMGAESMDGTAIVTSEKVVRLTGGKRLTIKIDGSVNGDPATESIVDYGGSLGISCGYPDGRYLTYGNTSIGSRFTRYRVPLSGSVVCDLSVTTSIDVGDYVSHVIMRAIVTT
jgi:hypothetical protein